MIRCRDGYVAEDVVVVVVFGEDVVGSVWIYVWMVLQCNILRDEGEDK